jgi:two-component system cell cycle response regulator
LRIIAMNVLVADDDAISCKILSSSLSRLGYSVEVVSDGGSAWGRLSGDELPELAILDWQMPGLDGPEICRRLRRRRSGAYTYVILVTSNGSPHLAAEGLEAGADDFITKPFDLEELRARVRAGERIVELQAEKERARAHLEAVVSNLDCAVLLIDPKGHVVYGNQALSSLSGMPLDAALQLTRQDFVRRDDEHRSEPDGLIERMAMGGTLPLDVEVDVEITRPERRMLRWVAKQVALPDGEGELDILRDVTAEIERDREQAKLARVDHLTGLHNRHAAEEIFRRELARARRAEHPLSLVLADIDRFKRVNDSYGHNAGDEVLRAVSRSLASCCRANDVPIRWGGEELLVLMPDTSLEGARSLAERMRAAVQALSLPDLPAVTISCGVAELDPSESSLESAVERADARLYEAKESGRNAVR